ncbi:MAG TPA: hypothetical protein VNF47_13080 [Streptosporangiaceae bacterium]|nr:hypothetical protein [Streptosporangiaceae bacterium]
MTRLRRAELLEQVSDAEQRRAEARRDYSEGVIDRADWLDIRARTEERISAARREYDRLSGSATVMSDIPASERVRDACLVRTKPGHQQRKGNRLDARWRKWPGLGYLSRFIRLLYIIYNAGTGNVLTHKSGCTSYGGTYLYCATLTSLPSGQTPNDSQRWYETRLSNNDLVFEGKTTQRGLDDPCGCAASKGYQAVLYPFSTTDTAQQWHY